MAPASPKTALDTLFCVDPQADQDHFSDPLELGCVSGGITLGGIISDEVLPDPITETDDPVGAAGVSSKSELVTRPQPQAPASPDSTATKTERWNVNIRAAYVAVNGATTLALPSVHGEGNCKAPTQTKRKPSQLWLKDGRLLGRFALYVTLPYTVEISAITMARSNTAEPRSHRLEARIAPKALALIRRPAEAKGSSLSDFAVAAAREAAARELEEQHIIRLSAQEQRQFVALLLDPPKPNKGLKRAVAAHTKLIKR
ncbi:MAG: DUF1778 domain-containing protein [Polyangiaceae bacterium]|nr:DUF1778 domain-containing protein [Polyangiaceae bacterium]